jgi:hypothetical protein
MKKNEHNMRNLWDTIKLANIHIKAAAGEEETML